MGKVAALLDRYRLVTVTGPGGVGKTRLADQVLRQVVGRFADGTVVVELAEGAEPAPVAATVATAVGPPPHPAGLDAVPVASPA